MIELSIIIPVYNVEQYLQKCIDSVLCQINDRIEVLCVNDGSTDRSLEIINQYAENDERVVLLNKENTGYGDSLNRGMKKARGKYIAILESDDYAVKGAYSSLLSVALESDADIVKGNYYNYNTNTQEAVYFENLAGHQYDTLHSIDDDRELFFTGPAIWSAIYKKAFLQEHDLRFLPTPGASYQDTSFAFKVWACAKKIVLVNQPVIYYRQDSAESSSNNSGKVFDICAELNEMGSFLRHNQLERFIPECMVAKFRSMKWSLDRLNGKDQLRFLMFMHTDAKKDCVEGHLKRELWSPYDWMIINNILFNVNNYAKKLLENKEPTSSLENLIMISKEISPVYIYNTDYYAGKLYGELVENDMQPTGFLSDNICVGNTNSIIPGEAISLDDINTDEGIILINANDSCVNELVGNLRGKFIKNYILVDVRKVW